MKKCLLVLLVLLFVGCINEKGSVEKEGNTEEVATETTRLIFGMKDTGSKRNAGANLESVKAVVEKYAAGAKRGSADIKIERVHSTDAVVKRYLDKNPNKRSMATEELETEAVNNIENEYEKALYLDYQVELPKGSAISEIMEELKENADVDYVQKDNLNEMKYTPNDPYFTTNPRDTQRLWGIKAIGADEAWDIAQGEDIIAAVVDSGVDPNHPDLRNNLWRNAQGTHGYDFSDKDNDPTDADGHGTHVAGTIGATANNGIGVAGVAPKVKILAAKIFPNAYDSVCSNALRYAVDNGAKVINNSWGPTNRSASNPVVERAIDYAHSKGVVVVFAAGNSNDNADYYSGANYSKTISVAAVDHYYKRASFSNYGSTVDIAAPGVRIVSTWPGGKYNSIQGTSMAAPHVTGLAAVMLSKNPNLTNEQVRSILKGTATKVNDSSIGAGVIDAHEALKYVANLDGGDDNDDDDSDDEPVVSNPKITALSKEVKAGGTITIQGTDFTDKVGKVLMAGSKTYTLRVTNWSNTEIKAVCTDGIAGGTYKIQVTTADQKNSNTAEITVTEDSVDNGERTREEIFETDPIFQGDWKSKGTNYSENIVGTDGNDTIYAYGGNDVIYSGKGTDTLVGGAGDDKYIYIAGEGKKVIYDSSGKDTLVFFNVNKDDISYSRSGYDLVVSSKKGNVDLVVKYHYYGNYSMEYVDFR